MPRDQLVAPWYFGGIAATLAMCCTYPIDLIRIQRQARLRPLTTRNVAKLLLKKRGIPGFYFAIGSAMWRQITYNSTRFGLYELARKYDWLQTLNDQVEVAATSGFLTGFLNTPIETVDIRTMTDVIKPRRNRRNYSTMWDGLKKLYREGGVRKGLYNACIASSLRGLLITTTQLVAYDQVTDTLLNSNFGFEDGWELSFFSSFIAGGLAALVVTPFGIVKKVMMDSQITKYNNIVCVSWGIYRKNGILGFYQAFTLSLLRFIPQTILTFLIYEQLRFHFGVPMCKFR